jgi:hypothetical protein
VCKLMRALPSAAINMSTKEKSKLKMHMSEGIKTLVSKTWTMCNDPTLTYEVNIHPTTREVATDASYHYAGISSPDGKH